MIRRRSSSTCGKFFVLVFGTFFSKHNDYCLDNNNNNNNKKKKKKVDNGSGMIKASVAIFFVEIMCMHSTVDINTTCDHVRTGGICWRRCATRRIPDTRRPVLHASITICFAFPISQLLQFRFFFCVTDRVTLV
jgi:hypothetical protein